MFQTPIPVLINLLLCLQVNNALKPLVLFLSEMRSNCIKIANKVIDELTWWNMRIRIIPTGLDGSYRVWWCEQPYHCSLQLAVIEMQEVGCWYQAKLKHNPFVRMVTMPDRAASDLFNCLPKQSPGCTKSLISFLGHIHTGNIDTCHQIFNVEERIQNSSMNSRMSCLADHVTTSHSFYFVSATRLYVMSCKVYRASCNNSASEGSIVTIMS